MRHSYLFTLVWHLLGGFVFTLLYCACTAFAVWFWEPSNLRVYLESFAASFNCLISGGLIVGAATFVFVSQKSVPQIIESSFDREELAETDFEKQKKRYFGIARSSTFSSNFMILAVFIFYFSKFPVTGIAEKFLIAFSCLEYGLGVYVGRKLFYIAYMLHAIYNIRMTKNIFRNSDLLSIITYVNIVSTLTVIFVYANVRGYYGGPFLYSSTLSAPLKIIFLLPAVIATPVLVLFNFYPRAVVRHLYSRSISNEVSKLTETLRTEYLSEIEKMSFVVAYDRLAKDELKGMLQLSLSDLPMGVTIIVMIIGLLLKT
jgi:hypothetical protein